MHRFPGPLPLLVAAGVALLVTVTGWAALSAARSPTTAVARVPGSGPAPSGPYEGPGRFAVWAYNDDGSAVRWDPCTPVRWTLNPDGAPASAGADLDAAIDRVEAVTGLEFEFVGTTDETPDRGRSPFRPERYGAVWAPVLVAWSMPGEGDLPLGDRDRGFAMPIAVDGPDGRSSYVSGQVVFSTQARLAAGFGTRHASWGATMMHELGHLVGLDHVEDPDEMMFTFPHPGPVEWGPGDRAGLRRVGSTGGCTTGGDPRPVEVVVR